MFLALFILAFGTFIQSSSYVPLRRIRGWHWETYWLIQGIFAWILLPLAGALLSVRSVTALISLYADHPVQSLSCVGFGFLWGIGGLTFGLAVRYLGISLGQTIAIGMCGALGSLLGPLLSGNTSMITPQVLVGVAVMLLGVFVVMLAALRKTHILSLEKNRQTVREFNLKKGVIVVLLSGLMSAFFNVALNFGLSIAEHCERAEFASLPVIFLVTSGGFLLNLIYCLFLGHKRQTFREYTDIAAWKRNLGSCAMTGVFWYSQFFSLSIVRGLMSDHPVFITFSWTIMMSLNIIFTNVWGLILREWSGTGLRGKTLLATGLCILVLSTFIPLL